MWSCVTTNCLCLHRQIQILGIFRMTSVVIWMQFGFHPLLIKNREVEYNIKPQLSTPTVGLTDHKLVFILNWQALSVHICSLHCHRQFQLIWFPRDKVGIYLGVNGKEHGSNQSPRALVATIAVLSPADKIPTDK